MNAQLKCDNRLCHTHTIFQLFNINQYIPFKLVLTIFCILEFMNLYCSVPPCNIHELIPELSHRLQHFISRTLFFYICTNIPAKVNVEKTEN
jgi:hypothetical protein